MSDQATVLQPHEDEIDLRELAKTLIKRKKFILAFTLSFTILAAIYAFSKTPIYELKSIIETGFYKDPNQNSNTLLDNTNRLVQELNVIFIDAPEQAPAGESYSGHIEAINTLKKNKNFFEVIAQGISNDTAKEKLDTVITYIGEKHKKIIDELIQNKEQLLKDLNRKITLLQENTLTSINEQIDFVKKEQVPALDKRIALTESDIKLYQKQLELTEANLNRIKSQNASLSALNIMEKRDLESRISELKISMVDLLEQKEKILQATLPNLLRERKKLIENDLEQLKEEKVLVELSLAPHNYVNTKVVGSIIQHNKPVKPKKKLIIAIATAGGFILSIFMVFLIEFIQSLRQEEQ